MTLNEEIKELINFLGKTTDSTFPAVIKNFEYDAIFNWLHNHKEIDKSLYMAIEICVERFKIKSGSTLKCARFVYVPKSIFLDYEVFIFDVSSFSPDIKYVIIDEYNMRDPITTVTYIDIIDQLDTNCYSFDIKKDSEYGKINISDKLLAEVILK